MFGWAVLLPCSVFFCGMHRAEETDPDSRPSGSHSGTEREVEKHICTTLGWDHGGEKKKKEEEEEVVAH